MATLSLVNAGECGAGSQNTRSASQQALLVISGLISACWMPPGCHGPPSAYLIAWTDHGYRLATSLSPDRVIMVFNRRKQAGLHLMLGQCPQLFCAGSPPVRRLPRWCAHRETSSPRGRRALPERNCLAGRWSSGGPVQSAQWRSGARMVCRCC